MEIHTVGIDLGKTVFHLVGLTRAAKSWFARSVPAIRFSVSRRTCRVVDRHGSLRRSALSCPCPA